MHVMNNEINCTFPLNGSFVKKRLYWCCRKRTLYWCCNIQVYMYYYNNHKAFIAKFFESFISHKSIWIPFGITLLCVILLGLCLLEYSSMICTKICLQKLLRFGHKLVCPRLKTGKLKTKGILLRKQSICYLAK